MDRKDLVKKILELSLELKGAEGVQAMMCITDMENAVKDYEKQLRIGGVSQQRELLEHFCGVMEFDIKHNTYEEDIDYFLQNYRSSNCG